MTNKGIYSVAKRRSESLPLLIATTLLLTSTWSSSGVIGPPSNLDEQRLRARIALAWRYFAEGKFEEYVAMWSAPKRPLFRESEEDWKRTVERWKLFLAREKPRSDLLEVQIMGLRARAKMRVSTLENGSRGTDILYDYWIFDEGDWFLDDAGRAE